MDTNPKAPLTDGNFLPLIGLGCLNFRPNDKTFNINDIIMKAAHAGYTHFDVTNNEQAIGEALKLVFEAKRQMEDEEGQKIPDQFEQAFPREKMFISYKVYNTPDIDKNIRTALQTMKLEYFDLVLLNCPVTPPPAPAEVPEGGEAPQQGEEKQQPKRQSMKAGWKMLQTLKEEGLVRSIGVANFTCQAILNLYPFVTHKPVVSQVESHPFLIQKGMLQICKKLKIAMVAYCPLVRGGKDQKVLLGDKIDYMGEPVLKDIANKYAKTIPQIVLNFQICRGVGVIPKTEKADHLNDNFNITDFELLEEDVAELQKLDKGGRLKAYQLKSVPIWRGEDPLC